MQPNAHGRYPEQQKHALLQVHIPEQPRYSEGQHDVHGHNGADQHAGRRLYKSGSNFFGAPQRVNKDRQIIGHGHFVIQSLKSITANDVLDPTTFAFFKGIDTAAQNGALSLQVAGGLPAGAYKLSSINSAANHQAVAVPVAQRGSTDDAIFVIRSLLLECQIKLLITIAHFLTLSGR